MLSFVNEMNEQNGNLIHSLSFNSKGELTWLASFNSLQPFVEEVLCLSGGKWSSPGGDTKLYQNQDLSIKWYTKSNTLAVSQGQVESKLNSDTRQVETKLNSFATISKKLAKTSDVNCQDSGAFQSDVSCNPNLFPPIHFPMSYPYLYPLPLMKIFTRPPRR